MKILEVANPSGYYDRKRVSNIINQARKHHRSKVNHSGGQVNHLVYRIRELERETPGWETDFWHNDRNTLARFFWMSPYQLAVARLYGEVIALDVSENRNAYKMHLTTLVVVDGENRTRNIAYCLSETEDTPMFVWLLQRVQGVIHKNKLSVSTLTAVFSDRDAAIALAVREVWGDAFHGVCLWHLLENIVKNLSSTMGPSFNAFMGEIWETYRMGSPETFETA
jgi:zinc finger SWIM domain-containing protein 3